MKSNQQSGAPLPELPETSFRIPVAGTWSISIAILISRVLGLVREMVMARYFGAGLFTDAFNVAYRIPNLLRDLFAEGALSAAFVPTFVRRLTKDGKEQAWMLANKIISALLVILGALTLAFFFGAKGFVFLLASGYADIPEKLELTVQMTRILSPFLLFVSLASVGMGILNACGSFFVPAMASSAFNLCCILAGLFLSPIMPYWGLDPIVSMAIGGFIGGASQFIVMIPSTYSAGFRYRFVLDFSDPGVRQMARLMLPAIIGLSATQINIAVDSQLASLYGNGPVSWLNYGFRLMQFPIGIFGIAIATTTTAMVSHYAARDAKDKLHRTLVANLRLAACLTFPATVGLIVFRHEIVRLIYEGGSFLPAHTIKTSQVVFLYALGLFSYSAVKILVPAFYALNDARTPVRISMITVAAKIVLNLILRIPFGFLGLALATSVASWLNCGLLMKQLQRKTGNRWQMGDLNACIRIALASMIMGILALLAFRFTGLFFPGTGSFIQAFRLGTAILTGMVVLIPLLRIFRINEATEIVRMIASPARKVL
ncbi:MAG: murein biosynthesis integral membrane protein MurJ [Acidobacteria bacterium]|nr:murein biosynthesis integral membrane protein MurJ [Acidobacteriota bacterium]